MNENDYVTALEHLRGDLREFRAEVAGRIETLAASKAGEHALLERRLNDVEYDAKTTTRAVQIIGEKYDKYARRVDRLVWLMLGSSFGGAGVALGIEHSIRSIVGG